MNRCLALLLTGCLASAAAYAGDADEFKVKREEVFEFAQPPAVTGSGDTYTVAFEAKGFCDVTVAIEDANGRIVRHLASGVLGDHAPPPFQKGTKKQSVVWDGKDDKGQYIDDKNSITVRVSLGLKALFEKNLFREPKRRHGREAPIFQVAPEGVYVYDGGNGLDFVELYNHDGSYLRTVYPFPGDKIDQVKGLRRVTYPQDGLSLPVKPTFLQQTFLTCGNLYGYEYPKEYRLNGVQADGDCHYAMYGNASSILAVKNGRIALGKSYLFRFATDGTSGGMAVEGPAVALVTKGRGWDTQGKDIAIAPRSAALSPDGKILYLAGYIFCHYTHASNDIIGNGIWDAFHAVLKMDLAGDKPPSLFAGHMEAGKSGADNRSFNVPAAVAVDKEGRVYVADFLNDRVQVFSPDGSYLKFVSVTRPAIVSIAPESQELYVFSSLVYNPTSFKRQEKVNLQLTVFGSFADPRMKAACPLPDGYGESGVGFWYGGMGAPLSAAVDDYTKPPTVWMAKDWLRENVSTKDRIGFENIGRFSLEGGALKRVEDFKKTVEHSVKRFKPEPLARWRLYADPKSGKVYVGEGQAFEGKSFKELIELDPETGRIALEPVPFDAEDMCFDQGGYAYLRTIDEVVRYESKTWREVPWDYGEERQGVCTSSSRDQKKTDALSALALPARAGWHMGGMYVSCSGNLAVACGLNLDAPADSSRPGGNLFEAKSYAPVMYPGRSVAGRGGAPLIHIWDKHGKVVAEDAVPGLAGNTYGLGLDRDNALYFMANSTRVIQGKTYLNHMTGTVIKALPKKPRLLSRAAGIPLPLPEPEHPAQPVDLVSPAQGPAWAVGVEWMYGGVGYDGKNAGVGCGCWNARIAFDYFARTFAPELDRYRVAVLDSNGNLVLRIGRYGNVDSAGPQSLVPLGGDEVGMVHGAYLAAITDKRLFIADPVSDRIFSVSLGYHKDARVALKDVPDLAN